MSKRHKKHKHEQPEQSDQPSLATEEGAAEQAVPLEVEAPGEIVDPFLVLQAQREELEQKLLRAAADYQNVVRRSEQNIITAREQQLLDVARSLLTVLDHFDRAMAVDLEQTSTQAVLDGVKIVRDELMRVLEQFGVQRINVSVGDELDPSRHEALMRKPAEQIQTNHVVEQLQTGYMLGNKTLRPAKVAVAE